MKGAWGLVHGTNSAHQLCMARIVTGCQAFDAKGGKSQSALIKFICRPPHTPLCQPDKKAKRHETFPKSAKHNQHQLRINQRTCWFTSNVVITGAQNARDQYPYAVPTPLPPLDRLQQSVIEGQIQGNLLSDDWAFDVVREEAQTLRTHRVLELSSCRPTKMRGHWQTVATQSGLCWRCQWTLGAAAMYSSYQRSC